MAEVLSKCKFVIITNGMLILLPKLADCYDLIITIGRVCVPFVVTYRPSEYISLLIKLCYVYSIIFNKIFYKSQYRTTM
jgi:hypothetical protein